MSQRPRMPQYIKNIFRQQCGMVPSAIIAGGAVRDTITGAYIKDVDIFVDKQYAHHYKQHIHDWTKLSRGASKLFGNDVDLGTWVTPAQASSTYQTIQYGNLQAAVKTSRSNQGFSFTGLESEQTSYGSRMIAEVYERFDSAGNPMNLIFTDCDPVEYVTKHFDFGLCKAWYDGNYIHQHGDFIHDLNNKLITLTLSNERLIELYGSVKAGTKAVQEHAYRIQAKHPSYTVVIPQV